MDPLENKIKKNYRLQKQEDEKTIPAFEIFMKNHRPLNRPAQTYLFLKVAASFLGAAVLISYYYFRTDRSADQSVKIQTIHINQPLPSQSLLDKSFEAGYIWKWKAPTDKLIDDANKLLKSGS